MHGDRTPRPTRPDPPCSGRRAGAGHHGGGDEVVSKVVSTMKGSGGCVTLTSSAFLPCLPPITPCLPHSSTLYSLSPQPLPLLGAPPHSPSLQTHDTHPMPPALRPLPTSTPTHIPPPPTSPLPTSIHPPPKAGRGGAGQAGGGAAWWTLTHWGRDIHDPLGESVWGCTVVMGVCLVVCLMVNQQQQQHLQHLGFLIL
ncbi:hypothetical protein E2C01_017840 [Portunus trituberculatus]|uniref:Uncharacterized protein n=1 Tax=Portunus trituberculatus TaxID=210409 RepID=A0A5B7DUX3_PORTR|nr:hypothetical protein [Portunus trituberculatus]